MRIPLLSRRDLFRDGFTGAAINTNKWTVTDTEGKLSIGANGLVCAGGKAVPAWGDPQALSVATFTRAAGLTCQWETTIANATGSSQHGFQKPSDYADRFGWYWNGGVWNFYCGGTTARQMIRNYTNGTSLLGKVVLKGATGAVLYISWDGGANWYPLWEESVSNAATYKAVHINFSQAFTSRRVRVYRGTVPLPVIDSTVAVAPSLGAELLTNGNFEGTFTGGLAASWAKNGAPTLAQEEVTVHGGTKSQKIVGVSNMDGVYQYATRETGKWYTASAWGYNTAGAAILELKQNNIAVAGSIPGILVNGAWRNIYASFRCTGTNGTGFFMYQSGATAITGYLDDATLKELSLPSTLSGGGDAGKKYGIHTTKSLVVPAGYQGGVVCNLDSDTTPLNYLQAYCERSAAKVYFLKVVNGTTTELANAAITYADNKECRLVGVPGTAGLTNSQWQCYYGNDTAGWTAIGTVQTIDISSGYGTIDKFFGTDSTVTGGITSYV